jgi:hypothetical protein
VRTPDRIAAIDRRALLPVDPLRDPPRRLEGRLDLRDQRKIAFAKLRAPLGVPVDLETHLALAPFSRARELGIILPPVECPTAQRHLIDCEVNVVAVRVGVVMHRRKVLVLVSTQ